MAFVKKKEGIKKRSGGLSGNNKKKSPELKPTHSRFDSTKSLLSQVGNLTLPEEKSIPKTNLSDYSILIYGEKKIGKTSLVSQFPKTFMLEFEPGGRSLELYQRPVPIWEFLLQYLELLTTDQTYKTICIDTGKVAYDLCLDYCCRIHGFAHPGIQNDYGASWSKVNKEFQQAHNRLFALNRGFVVISHSTTRERESYSGIKFSVIEPNLSGGSIDYYKGIMDNIFYYQFIKEQRFLRIRGDEIVTAGTRCKYNFKTPSGEPIVFIPMGNSEAEGYNNLVKAFNNLQTRTYKEFIKQ